MAWLWAQWAEEIHTSFDERLWAKMMVARMMDGALIPIVAYDGDLPIGCVDGAVFRDPMGGALTGMGDHCYVVPSHRNASVARQLIAGCMFIRSFFKCERCIVPVTLRDAPFLERVHAESGFEPWSIIMEWKQPCLKS